MMQAKTETTRDYSGSQIAIIDGEACVAWDMCRQFCRFDAISADPVYIMSPACPARDAGLPIGLPGRRGHAADTGHRTGQLSQTEHGSFAHARLLPGAARIRQAGD
jgi:hypothetical protein